jgi:hypothetical protein
MMELGAQPGWIRTAVVTTSAVASIRVFEAGAIGTDSRILVHTGNLVRALYQFSFCNRPN